MDSITGREEEDSDDDNDSDQYDSDDDNDSKDDVDNNDYGDIYNIYDSDANENDNYRFDDEKKRVEETSPSFPRSAGQWWFGCQPGEDGQESRINFPPFSLSL